MEDFLGTEHAVDTDDNHVGAETRQATSEEVKLECDLWNSALRNQSAPYLSEMHTAVDASQLADIVHEMGWLDVAQYQVKALKSAQAAADELQRTVRTTKRQHETDTSAPASAVPPAEAKLLTRAVAHLRTAVTAEPVWQSLPMPADTAMVDEQSGGRSHEVLTLPDGSRRVRDPALNHAAASIEDSLKASTHHIRSRWSGCLQAALGECGWPPTPAGGDPDGPAPAESAWRGFQGAPEASAAAAQAAFAALLQLQAARGMRPAAAAGPWADPELWAVRELLQEQLRGLQETFLSGGVFDRPDATAWVFQGATRALENVPEAVEGLQATVDAALPHHSYALVLEVARSMHAGVCELLLQHRLPHLPAAKWVPLADACISWERSVLPAIGCILPEDPSLISPSQLHGSLLTHVFSREELRNAWWAAEAAAATDAATAVLITDEGQWLRAPPGEGELLADGSGGAAEEGGLLRDSVPSETAVRTHALLQQLLPRCMWLGATTARMLMVQVVLGAALREYVKVVRRLLAKCHAYDEPLSSKWLPRLCAYSSSSRYLAAAVEDLLDTPALTPADATEAAVAAAAIAAVDAATAAAAPGSPGAAAAGSAPRVLRGALHAGSTALHAGHTAVASLGGFVAAALPRIGAAAAAIAAPLSAHADVAASAAAAATAAADAAAAAAAVADVAPPSAELLAQELREVAAVADACSSEAARAVAEAAVAELSGARAALRSGCSSTDVAAALSPAVEAVQTSLPRLAARLDRSGFQAAMRRVGSIIDEAVSTELREAATSAGTADISGMMAAICEALGEGFRPYSRRPAVLFKSSLA